MTSSSGSDVQPGIRTAPGALDGPRAARDDDRGEPSDPARLDEAALALVFAFRAWAGTGARSQSVPNRDSAVEDGSAELWHRLDASWARKLRAARDVGPAAALDPAAALECLRRMHRATIRVDLNRVHPSWCVRALKEESPTVQRLVAAHAPAPLRDAIRVGLSFDEQDLTCDRPVAPDVLSWALVLWAERLVGGDAARMDDPPAIAVLSRLSLRSGYAICRLAGQIKCGIGGQTPAEGRPSAARCARMTWLAESPAGAEPRLIEQVSHDLQSKTLTRVPGRHLAARLGAQTLARLLADSEPFRVRWALQHWPYPIAKIIRSLMPSRVQRSSWLARGEELILKTAWDRLNLEGRLTEPWPHG